MSTVEHFSLSKLGTLTRLSFTELEAALAAMSILPALVQDDKPFYDRAALDKLREYARLRIGGGLSTGAAVFGANLNIPTSTKGKK